MPIFTVKKLNSRTDLSEFDCSLDYELDLNGFIHNEALGYQRNKTGVTHLFYRNNKIVGFVTLAMGSIRKNSINVKFADYEKVNIPALFLGRLAVDNSERGKDIGVYLLEYCFGYATRLAKNELGCRFITLVTKKGKRTAFYSKHGFKKAKASLANDLEMMYFDLNED